jgi:hypothetical protein
MELAEQRALDAFKNVYDISSADQIQEVGSQYKAMCDFDIGTVNRKVKETEGTAERLKFKSGLYIKDIGLVLMNAFILFTIVCRI